MAEETKEAEGQVAEGGAEGAEGAEAAGSAKKKRLMMIVFAVVAVVGIGMGVGVYFMLSGGKKEEKQEAAASFLDLPQFAVNLLSEGDEAHFLKLKIAFELKDAADAPKIEAMMPVVQDDYQAFLRQMRVDDLRGTAALARLKDALLLRANQVLAPVNVRDVLFREVLVQ